MAILSTQYAFDFETIRGASYKSLPSTFSPLYDGSDGKEDIVECIDDEIRPRIISIGQEVKKHIEGRDDEVDACLVSLISGVPLVLFGPPGTAKSMIVRMISEYCKPPKDSKVSPDPDVTPYFEYLMTSHTMPEELFGPPNIEKLIDDKKFERESKNKLPKAEIAFLDELFRASGHILNTLLTIVNERLFHDGDTPKSVPLVGVITAANEPPERHSEVNAVFDRFPMRLHLGSVLDDLNLEDTKEVAQKLLKKTLEQELNHLRRVDKKFVKNKSEWIACTNDFRLARARLSSEEIPQTENRRFEEFNELFGRLRESHDLSDRSFGMFWRIGLAIDWLTTGDVEAMREPFRGYETTQGRGHLDVFRWIARDIAMQRDAENKVDDFCSVRGYTSNQ